MTDSTGIVSLATLVLGSYAFTCVAFVWSWVLYRQAMEVLVAQGKRLDELWLRVANHQAHEIGDLTEKIDRMERRLGLRE